MPGNFLDTNEDNKTYGKDFTIPPGQKDWMEVRLPFQDFVIYGKDADSAPDRKLPDPQKIIGLEVKLRDGAYGPFELEVDEIAIDPEIQVPAPAPDSFVQRLACA